nr:hypothetical protein [Chloroflexia bacterium]
MSDTNPSDSDLGNDAHRAQLVSNLHPLRPGEAIPGDWCGLAIPENVEAAPGTRIDSAAVFKTFRGRRPAGLRIGRDSTLCGTKLTVGPRGLVEVGAGCYLADAIVLCEDHVTLGDRVAVA